MKKQCSLTMRLVLLTFFITLNARTMYAQDDDLFCEDTSFYNAFDSNWLSQTQFQTTRSQATPGDIVTILIDIGVLNLLQANIYKRTNPLNIRNLLDYPSYLPTKYSSACWTTGVYIFYNHTDRDFFTRTSDKLSSYLGICDPKLLEFLSSEILQELIQEEFPNFVLDPLDVMPLFKNMTIQERRLGVMFHGMKRLNNRGRFRFMFPVFYLESNFWLTENEQRAVEERFGSDPNQDDFAEQHMISDKVGVGDLRLTYDVPLIDRSFFHLRGGVLTTIPVSFPFKRGLKGSKFSKTQQRQPFDLVQLFCDAQGTPAEQKQAAQQGLCFFLNALDQLSSTLIEVPLGNGRHLGLGGYVRYKSYLRNLISRQWAENVTFNSYVSLELLMPARHKRFYIEKNDQAAFDALGLNQNKDNIIERIEDDPEYAAAVLSFFETQMTEKFFPFALDTLVWPGFVFRWTTKGHYEGQRWGLEVGFDTWVQAKEHIGGVCIPKTIPQDLNFKITRRSLAYQWKLFGTIFFKNKQDTDNWLLSLTGDYTFANTGIGSDYMMAINIERHF